MLPSQSSWFCLEGAPLNTYVPSKGGKGVPLHVAWQAGGLVNTHVPALRAPVPLLQGGAGYWWCCQPGVLTSGDS